MVAEYSSLSHTYIPGIVADSSGSPDCTWSSWQVMRQLVRGGADGETGGLEPPPLFCPFSYWPFKFSDPAPPIFPP